MSTVALCAVLSRAKSKGEKTEAHAYAGFYVSRRQRSVVYDRVMADTRSPSTYLRFEDERTRAARAPLPSVVRVEMIEQ